MRAAEIAEIFRNLREVLQLHRRLYQELRARNKKKLVSHVTQVRWKGGEENGSLALTAGELQKRLVLCITRLGSYSGFGTERLAVRVDMVRYMLMRAFLPSSDPAVLLAVL